MDNLISIVVPCYNEEESIPLFLAEIEKIQIDNIAFEYIFVDDGSTDKTLPVIKQFAQENTSIRYVSFSRNFGKEAALLAGLEATKGQYIVVMDADLQDPPSLIPEMYAEITENEFDCVATRRTTRKGEPPIRSFFAKMFYKIINRISDVKMVDGARDYRMMTRQVVDSILSMREYNRFSKGLFNWVGYNTKYIAYENIERVAGSTKWNFWGLFSYSLDGIIAFSVKPLLIASYMGLLFCSLSFFGIVFIIFRYLAYGDPVQGWASTVVIVLFTSGISLFTNGILGQYISRIYLEVKNRPVYITKESDK